MKRTVSYTLSDLAARSDSDLKGDGDLVISGLSTLQTAGSSDLSFLTNRSYRKQLEDTQAGALILSPDLADEWSGNALVHQNPYLCFARMTHLFDTRRKPDVGVHPTAFVADDACIDPSVSVGANAVIESGAVLAAGVVVESGVVVGFDSVVGESTLLSRGVTLCHGVTVGKRCIIHPGAVIGSDGFGNADDGGKWYKIAQIGAVVIGDDVEIGASSCIDRGSPGDTVIHDGVRIDNLVQVAHNVVIGENTAIAAQTGISGSTTIGARCRIAGAVGIAGHLSIADDVQLAGRAEVRSSVKEAGMYGSGTPLGPYREWMKQMSMYRNLKDIVDRLRTCERKLDEL